MTDSHSPKRYANLERIRRLDPETDFDEIAYITSRYEFPWDYVQGTGIAFLRDYGVPSIARLLDRTGEFEHHGIKRYDDTLLIGEEATVEGINSPRARDAVRRLNQIHGHYDIPDDEFAFVLATTIVGPVRWINEFGWRPLDPKEIAALTKVTTRFGEMMGIKGLPTTYDGYERLLVDYETERFEFTPANRRLTEASIRIARDARAAADEAADPQGDHRADGRAAPGRPRHAAAAGLVRPRRARRAAPAGPGRCGSSRRAARPTTTSRRRTRWATGSATSARRRCWTT